jgi:flagellar hook protein FlgE
MTYSRDGSFRFDKDGWLTNLNGNRVQAYQGTPDGQKISGKLGDIRLPFNTIPAKPTNKVQLHVNLDARVPASPTPLDLARPEETSQFTSAVQVFDSVGNAHSVGLYFTRTGDSTWEWAGMTDGANLAGGTPGQPTAIAQGTLTFDAEGKLFSNEQTLVNTTFANGAIPDQNLQFDFGSGLATENGNGMDGTTMYGSKSGMFRNVQDGWSAGYLTDTMIDSDGNITGVYTNGQNKLLGQLALARFESNERLAKVGENQFRETTASGQPSIGKPNTNGRGVVMTKSLENSNVDLAKEFVEMIKVQRGFQASTKSITTANEMLDEVINIKRT